jgi:hypothetical protein
MTSWMRKTLEFLVFALKLDYIKFRVEFSKDSEFNMILTQVMKDGAIDNRELALLIEYLIDKAGI